MSNSTTTLFNHASTETLSRRFIVRPGQAVMLTAFGIPEETKLAVKKIITEKGMMPDGDACSGPRPTIPLTRVVDSVSVCCDWAMAQNRNTMFITVPGVYQLELDNPEALGSIFVELMEIPGIHVAGIPRAMVFGSEDCGCLQSDAPMITCTDLQALFSPGEARLFYGIDNAGRCVTSPVPEFVETPLVVHDSQTITIINTGPMGHDITASVRISGDPGNIIEIRAGGLYVETRPETPFTADDSATIDFTTSGSLGHRLTGTVRISGDPGNTVVARPDGLYVPPPAAIVETPLIADDSPTVDFTLSGPLGHRITAVVKVSQVGNNRLSTNPDGLYVPPVSCSDIAAVFSPGTVALAYGRDAAGNCVFGPVASGPGVVVETPLTANDSSTVDFTQTGTLGHTLTATVKVDPAPGNIIVVTPNGLRVERVPITCTDVTGMFAPGTPVAYLGVDAAGNCVRGTPAQAVLSLNCEDIAPIFAPNLTKTSSLRVLATDGEQCGSISACDLGPVALQVPAAPVGARTFNVAQLNAMCQSGGGVTNDPVIFTQMTAGRKGHAGMGDTTVGANLWPVTPSSIPVVAGRVYVIALIAPFAKFENGGIPGVIHAALNVTGGAAGTMIDNPYGVPLNGGGNDGGGWLDIWVWRASASGTLQVQFNVAGASSDDMSRYTTTWMITEVRTTSGQPATYTQAEQSGTPWALNSAAPNNVLHTASMPGTSDPYALFILGALGVDDPSHPTVSGNKGFQTTGGTLIGSHYGASLETAGGGGGGGGSPPQVFRASDMVANGLTISFPGDTFPSGAEAVQVNETSANDYHYLGGAGISGSVGRIFDFEVEFQLDPGNTHSSNQVRVAANGNVPAGVTFSSSDGSVQGQYGGATGTVSSSGGGVVVVKVRLPAITKTYEGLSVDLVRSGSGSFAGTPANYIKFGQMRVVEVVAGGGTGTRPRNAAVSMVSSANSSLQYGAWSNDSANTVSTNWRVGYKGLRFHADVETEGTESSPVSFHSTSATVCDTDPCIVYSTMARMSGAMVSGEIPADSAYLISWLLNGAEVAWQMLDNRGGATPKAVWYTSPMIEQLIEGMEDGGCITVNAGARIDCIQGNPAAAAGSITVTPYMLNVTSLPIGRTGMPPPTLPTGLATFERPFSIDSPWNLQPVNPVLNMAVGIHENTYTPDLHAGNFSVKFWKATAADGPHTVYPITGRGGISDADLPGMRPSITFERFPSGGFPADSTDGHFDFLDEVTGLVHSLFECKLVGGQWQIGAYAVTRLDGRGFGDGAHWYQGVRAVGCPPVGGLIRTWEVTEGVEFEHALCLSLPHEDLMGAPPGYVYPATFADDGYEANTGTIPEGALLMLPANFNVDALRTEDCRRVARALKKYGARVVDRNFLTPFVIYVEQGTIGFGHGGNWVQPVADDLLDIRLALHPVTSTSGWRNVRGQVIADDPGRLNMLSLRNPWTVYDGSTNLNWNVEKQRLEFGAVSSAYTLIGSYGIEDRIRPFWAQPVHGATYRLALAGVNATFQMQVVNAADATLYSTPYIAPGQSHDFVWPATAVTAKIWILPQQGSPGGWISVRMTKVSDGDDPDTEPEPPGPTPPPAPGPGPAPGPAPVGPTAAISDPVTSRMVGLRTFDVGPGQTHADTDTVPWATLVAGDVVNIHYRPEPYSKFGMRARGTAANHVVVNGVTDSEGRRPAIGAQTRTAAGCNPGGPENVFSAVPEYGEALGVIVIKRGSTDSYFDYKPEFIDIKNLDIGGALYQTDYTTLAGATAKYGPAASIYLLPSKDILIENCVIHDSAFGVFTMAKDGLLSQACENITVRTCRITQCGRVGSFLEHGIYMQATNPVVEGCYLGKLRAGATGSTMKSRSARDIIRYNWIETSMRAIDMVHSEEQDDDGILVQPQYGVDYVYGNVIVNDGPATAINPIHYGGDNDGEDDGTEFPAYLPSNPNRYRRHLFFFGNTVYQAPTSWRVSMFQLSLQSIICDAWNNVLRYNNVVGMNFLMDKAGILNLRGANLVSGVTDAYSDTAWPGRAVINDLGTTIESNPLFASVVARDFRLTSGSPARDTGVTLIAGIPDQVLIDHPVEFQPVVRSNGLVARESMDNGPDLGALEFGVGGAPGATTPVNTIAPSVGGDPSPGGTLSVSTGTWEGANTYSYQTLRNGAVISGATANTYVVQSGDIGATISWLVTATNDVGPETSYSNGVVVSAAAVALEPDANGLFNWSTTDGTSIEAVNTKFVMASGVTEFDLETIGGKLQCKPGKFWNGGTYVYKNGQGADQSSRMRVAAGDLTGPGIIRLYVNQSADFGYWAAIGPNSIQVRRNNIYLDGFSHTVNLAASSGVFEFTKVGGVIKLFANGVEIFSYTDAAPVNDGWPGFSITGESVDHAKIDAWTDSPSAAL